MHLARGMREPEMKEYLAMLSGAQGHGLCTQSTLLYKKTFQAGERQTEWGGKGFPHG